MKRLIIEPESIEHWLDLRLSDITSTECSALFGASPYMTEFELWHNKKNKVVVKLKENERMKWGKRLEHAIASGIAEDLSIFATPFTEYVRLPELRAGSSFDFTAIDKEGKKSILEIKNVDYLQMKEKWIVEDGEVVEAPPHIEIQVQHQLMVSGLEKAYIGALVGGNSLTIIERGRDERIIKRLINKIESFWKSIEDGNPPSPDYERDSSFICSIYDQAKEGKISNATHEISSLARSYKEASERESIASKEKSAIKAKIIEIIKDNEKVLGEDFTISCGNVKPKTISYERAGYRNFKITFKKSK